MSSGKSHFSSLLNEGPGERAAHPALVLRRGTGTGGSRVCYCETVSVEDFFPSPWIWMTLASGFGSLSTTWR